MPQAANARCRLRLSVLGSGESVSNPIVIEHHLIWTLYGWWLPNDLRGSTSHALRCDALRELGELHSGRKTIQPASRDIRALYSQAQALLKHPLLELTGGAVASVALRFAGAIGEFKYTCYACSILRDHVHLIVRKQKHTAEQMIEKLQNFGRLRLSADGYRSSDHPTWVRGGWKVFLDHPDEVRRTIPYVEKNPLAYGEPVQKWHFITAYDNWPLIEGHSANSPFATALRAAGRYPHDRQAVKRRESGL